VLCVVVYLFLLCFFSQSLLTHFPFNKQFIHSHENSKYMHAHTLQLADGIMGMDNADAAYWKQMYDRKVIKRKAFSLCFSRNDSIDRGGTESGAMTLGGTDRRLHKSPMVYSSTGDSSGGSGFYAITLRNIYLRPASGGTSAQSDVPPVPLGMDINAVIRSQVIVDSGTTDTYFTRALEPYFSKVWKSMTGADFSHNKKVKLTDDELDAMPTIIFQLKGDSGMNTGILNAAKSSGQQSVIGLANLVDPANEHDIIIAMPPRHYMEFDDDDETWTARFYVDESGSGGVLGANMMMGHDLLFDIENNRIGWAEADCDYTALIQQYGTGWADGSSHPPPVVPAPSPQEGGGDDIEPVDDDSVGESDDLTPGVDDTIDTSSIPSQEGLPKTKDEPTLPDSQFCSSLTCQGGVIAFVLAVVVFVAVRLLRSSAGGSYEVADSGGLELKSGNLSVAATEDSEYGSSTNGNGTQYRDHLPNIS
jgi:Eukaryotic aspartyl protease